MIFFIGCPNKPFHYFRMKHDCRNRMSEKLAEAFETDFSVQQMFIEPHKKNVSNAYSKD